MAGPDLFEGLGSTKEVLPDDQGPNGAGSNGAGPVKGTPSVDDMVMEELGQPFNPLAEMMKFSEDPAEFITRSVVKPEMSVDMIRSLMMHDLWEHDEWDHERLLWNRLAFSVAENGLGREQAVQMYGGTGGFLGNMRRKLGGFNSGPEQSAGSS